jgi:hypothetical protein
LPWARENIHFDKTEDEFNENGNIIYQANIWKDRVVTTETFKQYAPELLPILTGIIFRMKKLLIHFLK